MAKLSEVDRQKKWQDRVNDSNRAYKEWEDQWSPDMLEQYYYGQQWQNDIKDWDKRKYVINLFYPSINTRRPSLLFFRPKVKIEPRPGREDDPQTDIVQRAQLQEDTVNTFITQRELGFNLECGLAVLDAQFRFGVIEVGYTADFIDNPNAGKPALNDDMSPIEDVIQPAKIPTKESLFLKWIPGKTWRVSVNAHNRLKRCDWVGYYEWQSIEDVKKNPNYSNTKNLKATGRAKGEKADTVMVQAENASTIADEIPPKGMLKVWKIWSLRKETDGTQMKRVWAEGNDKFLLEEPYKIFPFGALKFDEILNAGRQWYPLPPVYNWVSPQNELNETREMQRIHRKRFKRQFQGNPNCFATPDEKNKWEEGEDGSFIETTGEGIRPILDAQLDQSVVQNIPFTKDDFREISGISGEERGIAQADTATQANIIQVNSQIRESFGRVQVSEWLSEIADIMLRTIKEYMVLPFWIKMNVDPLGPSATQEAARVGFVWKEIESEKLGELNYDVTVAVESMSPVSEDNERNIWLQMLMTVANPQLQIMLASSDVLLEKTVGYFGIHNQRDIAEIQKAMGMSMMAAAQAALQQAAAKQQGKSGGGLPQMPQPGPTPSNPDIVQQLQAQMPQPQAGM